jgi:signal transduction histidine kinase/ActR/RegA family two-component response regulator
VLIPESAESEQEKLADSERRHRILSDASRLLLDYVGPDEIEPLRRIVKLVTEAMGEWVSFSLVQPDGTTRSVAAYHPDPRQRELEKKLNTILPPSRWDANPEFNPLVLKRPVVIEHIPEELLNQWVKQPDGLALLKEVGLTSLLATPMFDGPQPMGTMLLATTGPGGKRHSEAEIDFAYSLAGRAGLAVRNARLVRQISEERDRQEEARIESDRRAAELRAVLHSEPNGIALFDAKGTLQIASRRLEELFGAPLGTMLGQPWQDIYRRKLEQVVSGSPEQHFARVAELFANSDRRAQDEVELDKPRHRFLTRLSVPVRGAKEEYLGRLFVYVDVTEQRKVDQQRADFLTIAAHELRTPLTPLSMYLQSIERRLQRQQTIEPEMAVKARRQVGRLTRLVEDLLDVSRLESKRLSLARERVVIDDLVDQVVGDFRSASRQHEIIFHRPQTRAVVEGDRVRLEQVLVNLLTNAIKYSPQGDPITLKVEKRSGEVRISVSDQGIGIPAEDQDKLFQRFFRAYNATARNYGGLGIGLYVSNEIVRGHGGHFEVQSEPGRGSTFTVFLPLAHAQENESDGKARVLLVDDDPEILEATGQVLREWGYAVDEARDGQTALELARGARPDLMLVDLMMPVMDGWALIARLREEQLAPGVPLVVFSADRDAGEKARQVQADAALRKPFELEELQEVVERLLVRKQGAGLSPQP